MAEITQKLGFETSQAVTALNNLTASLNQVNGAIRTLNGAKLTNVNKSLAAMNKNLGTTGNTAATAGKQVQGFAAGSGGNIAAANQQLGILNGTFQTTGGAAKTMGDQVQSSFAKFFILNKAVGLLKDFVGLLNTAADASQKFQQSIAEVSTISGDAFGNFEQLKGTVRDLAVEFGKPTIEVAEGLYQTLSNQVGDAARSTEVLTGALKLGIATVASTADSVSVLSSVVNTYGDEAGSVTDISNDLFTTVEQGTTRLSEFAKSLGTILSPGKNVGITLQEVLAAMASITKTGTTTSVSLTQIRGIITKLQKPTNALKEVFKELGVEGFAELKAQSGDAFKALLQIEKTAGTLGISMADVFGRIRATTGALNLLRDGASNASEVLDKLNNNAGAVDEAFKKIEATDARAAERAMNNLKTAVEQLGDAVLPIRTLFVQALGAATKNTTLFAVAIGTAIVAMSALVIQLGLATFGITTMTAALFTLKAAWVAALPVLGPIIAIGGAIAIVTLAIQKQERAVARLKEGFTATADAAKASADAQLAAAQKAVKDQEGVVQARKAALNQAFGDQIAAAQEANKITNQSFTSVVDAFVSSRQRIINSIKNSFKAAESEIAASTQRLKSITQQLDDIKFDKQTKGLSDSRKAAKTLQRALQTAAQSRRDLAAAGLDQDKAREAISQRNLSLQQLEVAAAAAAATDSKRDDKLVAQAKERLLQQFAKDEKARIAELKKLNEANAKKAEAALERQTKKIQTLVTEFKKLGNPLNASGAIKSVENYEAGLREALGVAKEISAELAKDATGGFADQIGQGDALKKTGGDLAGGLLDVRVDQDKIRNALKEVIESKPFKAVVEAEVKLGDLQNFVLGADAKSKIAGFAQEVQNNLRDATSALTVDLSFGDQIQGQLDRAGEAVVEFATGSNVAGTAFEQFTRQVTGALAAINQGDQAGLQSGSEQLANAADILQRAKDSGKLSESQIKQAETALKAAQGAVEAQASVLEGEAALTDSKLKDTAQSAGTAATNAGTLATNIGTAATAASNVQASTAPLAGQIQAAVGPANALASALERAARARAAAGAGGGGGTETAFFGKAIHRQTGGFTRGQDRIATSTAPGEFVMNAASTRQFRSQLTAMNAKQKPQFREQGGAVTNVGDINVNIQSSDASDVRGRDVARDLKRELRTRSSSL